MPQYELPNSLLRSLLQQNPTAPVAPPPGNVPHNNCNSHKPRICRKDPHYASVDDLDRDPDFIPRKPNARRQCLNSKTFWILLIVLFLLVSLVTGFTLGLIPALWNWISEADPCSSGYSQGPSTGDCYKCFVTPLSFEKASKTCSSEGGSLVSIHSETENDFVIDLYHQSLASYRKEHDILMKRSHVWIGLIFNEDSKQWEWTDGTELDYTKWAPGEPNIMNQKQYWTKLVLDEIEGYNPNGNKWNNIGEADLYAFVCKKPNIHVSGTTKRPRVTEAPPKTTVPSTTIATTTTIPKCSSGYTYSPQTDHCYKIVFTAVTFEEAKRSCESEESHLASIHSAEENEFLLNLYNSSFDENNKDSVWYQRINGRNVWIGLVFLNGGWKWTDGTEVDYQIWGIDEPNNLGAREWWTVIVNEKWPYWTPKGREWNNVPNTLKLAYFCKKPSILSGKKKFTTIEGPKIPVKTTVAPTTTTPAPLPKCSSGYTYLPATSHCYKVSLPGVDFFEAKQSCESEESHLASIHSAEENEFLKKLYTEKLEDHNKNSDTIKPKRNVWIGLVYVDGEWVWTDGTKLDYKNYAVNEPNKMSQHEYWTVMVVHLWEGWTPNANEWNNIDSNRQYAFFCKKPVVKQKFTTIEGPKIPLETTVAPMTTTTEPPPKACSPGYQLLVHTGFCYKVHNPSAKVKMEEAEKSCRSEDAHLASIHSDEENRLLADLSRKSSEVYPASSFVPRLNEQDEVIIGLFVKNGKWEWSDESPVNYTNWGMGEPNRMEFEWTTTLVTSKITTWNPEGQLWNNVPNSSAQRAFICKKAPT